MRRTRAAQYLDAPDFLLRRAVEDIAERLQTVTRSFERVLCIGAYHGVLPEALLGTINPSAEVISVEACPVLLAHCPAPRICADEEYLPFRDGTFDLVASALSLQLVNDLPGALVQIRQALKPDGLFLGAVLGGNTLNELREALMLAEVEVEGGASPRVAPMAEVRDYGTLLQRAGFAMPVVDTDTVEVFYATPLALMVDLRRMGTTNALTERRKTFLRRATLRKALQIYEERFSVAGGRVKATFEIIHLAGWAPDESQPKPLQPGSACMPFAEVLGRIRDTQSD
jgi:NADH dehydrogenase [ubiquinone] 1 alpha subcomplex assembly factor 5